MVKRGRPTKDLKDFMLRVRFSQTDLDMLDTLCLINDNISRSAMIRQMIISTIRADYYDIMGNKDIDNHIKELFSELELLSNMEDVIPLEDEIDNLKK